MVHSVLPYLLGMDCLERQQCGGEVAIGAASTAGPPARMPSIPLKECFSNSATDTTPLIGTRTSTLALLLPNAFFLSQERAAESGWTTLYGWSTFASSTIHYVAGVEAEIVVRLAARPTARKLLILSSFSTD